MLLFYKIIIKVLGGFWELKLKCNETNYKYLKRIYIHIYTYYLDCYGSYIGRTAEFKKPAIFPHGISGIFIAPNCKIGENCTIYQQVTIGENSLKDSLGYGSPSIGNNVFIGAGAKIIGNVKIGNNVRIGANCVVIQDIPNNAVVVLQKPRVIIKKY